MAAIQSIQNHPKVLLGVLGVGLVLMIIMFGFDDYNGLFQGDRDTVMSVNGKKVSWAQFETERQRQSDFIQSMGNQDVNKAEISHQINNQVYSQYLQESVLDEVLNEAGISVCNAEVNELVQGSHISPVLTQIFGEAAAAYGHQFAELVSNDNWDEFQRAYGMPFFNKSNWLYMEHQIKLNRKSEKFNALLAAAIQPNKLEAMDVYNGENTDVAFSYVSKFAVEVPDSLVSLTSKDIKAYYMKVNPDDKTVAAVDLLVPGVGEIIGGSEREADYDKLVASMNERGMNLDLYSDYLDLRKFGSVPHGGFGLGFERLVMYVTGVSNIRDVTLYPRTVGNIR